MKTAHPLASVTWLLFAGFALGLGACGGDEGAASTGNTVASGGTKAAGGSSAAGAAGSVAEAGGGGQSGAAAGGSGGQTAGAGQAGTQAFAGASGQAAAGSAGAGGEGPSEDDDPGDPDDGDPGVEIPPETPPGPNQPDDDEPTSRVLTIATWNANYNNEPPVVRTHIETIDADIIGLQEMGSPAHAAAIVDPLTECEKCVYVKYFPQEANAHACPILWKKDKLKKLDAGSFKVNDAQVIKDGGSRTNLLTKATVWVLLEDKQTGAKLYVSNNHLVPSVELNGKPFPGREARLKMFAEHMDGIVKTIDKANDQNVPIFVTGDFNVNFRKDKPEASPVFPYARFKAKNVFANWNELGAKPGVGTHAEGSRLIDYVHASRSKLVELKDQVILPKGGSDHHPVRVKVRVHAAKK